MEKSKFLFVIGTEKFYNFCNRVLLREIYIKYLLKENAEKTLFDILIEGIVSMYDNTQVWKKDNDIMVRLFIRNCNTCEKILETLLRDCNFTLLEESEGKALEKVMFYMGERVLI